MRNVTDNKFTWVVKKFSDFSSSHQFVIGGCKWSLMAYTEIVRCRKYLSLYMFVADSHTLPCGWRRHTKYRLTVVNQLSEKLSLVKDRQLWFDHKVPCWDFPKILPLTKLHDKDGGFLVNNEFKIVAEVDVLQVIGNLDIPEVTQTLKRIKLNVGGDVSSHLHKETIDVGGFQVLPSQVESVKRIFEKHPNMALHFQAKSQYLRTICMNALLNLIQTLCQPLQDLSIDDLGQADNTLTYLKNSGFKVDWLERKLEQVKEKKMEEDIGETRMQELEEELRDIEARMEKNKEELKDLEKKCFNTKALLKNEKANILAAKAPPLTLDDVVC